MLPPNTNPGGQQGASNGGNGGAGASGPNSPQQPQQPQKKPCSPGTRIAEGIKAASGLGDASISFGAAGIHFGAAFAAVSAGCLDPTPFEPATCIAGGVAAVDLTAGGTLLGSLAVYQVKDEVIPGIMQAFTCEP